MNKLKSLISIFLTAVMIFTAVPSAFASGVTVEVQSENYDFSAFATEQKKEQFNDYNKFVNRVGSTVCTKHSTDNGGVYSLYSGIIITNAMTVSLVPGASSAADDYALEFMVDSGKSGGLIQIGGISCPADGTLSYQFDLKVLSDGAMVTTEPQYVSLWTGTSGDANNDYLINNGKLGGTDYTFPVGVWVKVKMDFDVSGKKWDVYINGSKKVDGVSAKNPDALHTRLRMTIKNAVNGKGFGLDNIKILSIPEEKMSLMNLESNVSSSDNVTFDVVIPDSFTTAEIFADDVSLGTFEAQTGKTTYTVTIPAGTLPMGSNIIKVSADCSGGVATAGGTVKVAQAADRGVATTDGTETSTDVFTFDSLKYSTGAAMNDEVGLTEIKWNIAEQNTPWQTNANAFMVPGPSGKDTDYGLQIRSNTNLIQIYHLDTANPPSTGKLVLDMDILCDSDGTNVKMSKQMGRPDSQTSFLSANKLFGSIEIEAGVWTHVNMVFDFDTSKWTVRANGEEVTYDSTSQTKTFDEIRFTLYSSGTPFAIDNARIYNTRYYSGVESMEYIVGSDAYPIAGAVPADADAVKLITGEGIDADTLDSIKVTDTSGNAVPTSITYSSADKSLTITPKNEKFPEARGIIVAFGEGTKFADGTLVAQPYSVAFDVESASITTDASFYVNGSDLNDGTSLGTGDVVSVDITAENIASAQSTSTYVLSLRKITTLGGEQISQLVSLKAKDVSLSISGTDTFTLTLPAITESGEYEVYLMIIDSFANSKSKAEYIKFN